MGHLLLEKDRENVFFQISWENLCFNYEFAFRPQFFPFKYLLSQKKEFAVILDRDVTNLGLLFLLIDSRSNKPNFNKLFLAITQQQIPVHQ